MTRLIPRGALLALLTGPPGCDDAATSRPSAPAQAPAGQKVPPEVSGTPDDAAKRGD